MPSPVGHSMIGLSLGLLYAWPRGSASRPWTETVRRYRVPLFLSVLAANLPDIDYLPGVLTGDINAYHHHYTHTLGWIILVTAGLWMVWKAFRPAVGVREALFLFACMAAHLLADLFTDDRSYPYGIMIGWPLSDQYALAPWPLFPRPLKADWGEVFDWHNVRVVVVEFLFILPCVILVLAWKRTSASLEWPWRRPRGKP